MRPFADDGDAERIELLPERFRNLVGHPLLDLQPSRKHIYEPGNLAQADHPRTGDVSDVALAEKRQQVVLAQAVEVDILDDHHLVVIDGEERVVQHLVDVGVIAAGQKAQGLLDARRRAKQTLTVWILAELGEQGTDQLLHRHIVHAAIGGHAYIDVCRGWRPDSGRIQSSHVVSFAHPSLAALRHRNFRLIWIGMFLSFTGSFMQNAALLWHVSLLVPPGRKGLALGLVGLSKFVPIVVFSMISGVVADAWDRRRLMLITQVGLACVAFALAALTLAGLTAVWPLYLLAALGSAVGSFDLPARQSLVPTLVPRSDLPNAISLNTIMVQAASVLGPAFGGLLIATSGVAAVYVVNALSFAAVIAALLMMRGVPAGPPDATDRDNVSWRAAREGLDFVFSSPLIRSTMLLDFFATFFSSATALLPIFAQDVLEVGPRGYGWLYAAPAVGATAMSAAMVFLTDRIEHRGRALIWAVAAYGAATIGFGLSRVFWLTFLCLALTGVADTVSMIIRNVIRQLETPDRLRGRMAGINMVFFAGGPQLGEIEAGLVANWFGAALAVITGGIGCLMTTTGIAAATPQLRRYRASRSRDRG
jgi:MFS family permease